MNSPKSVPDEKLGKEVELNQTPLSTSFSNPQLLQVMSACMHKKILLETKDGKCFRGTFACSSPDMTSVGMFDAYEITSKNEGNLLPMKSEVTEKMRFSFDDVTCISVLHEDAFELKGFASDSCYHDKNGFAEAELEKWDDGDEETIDNNFAGAAKEMETGWDIASMYKVNKSLGVHSTFEASLAQYTNAEVIDDPARKRSVERIAREIEQSQDSKRFARLENDDEERDLDKLTASADLDHRKKRPPNRGRRNTLPPNQRTEALRATPVMRNEQPPNSSPSFSRPDWKNNRNRGRPDNNYGNKKPQAQEKQVLRLLSPCNLQQGPRGEEALTQKKDVNSETKTPTNESFASPGPLVESLPVATSTPRGAWNNGPPQSIVIARNSTSPSNSVKEALAEDSLPKNEAEVKETLEKTLTESKEGAQSATKSEDAKDVQDKSTSENFHFNLDAPAFVPNRKSAAPNDVALPPEQQYIPQNQMPMSMPPHMMLPQPPPNPMMMQYYPQMHQPMIQPQQMAQFNMAGAHQRVPPVLPGTNRVQTQQQQPQAMVFAAPHQMYQFAQMSMPTAPFAAGVYPIAPVPPPQHAFVQQVMGVDGRYYPYGPYANQSQISPTFTM